MIVPQLFESLGLLLHTSVVFRRRCNLENIFLVIFLNQQHNGAAALSKSSQDSEAIGKKVIFSRDVGVEDDVLRIRRSGFVFDFLQEFEEITDRVDSQTNVSMGAPLNKVLQAGARAVQDGADLQPLCFSQLVAEFQAIRRRRLAREDVVGNRSQREHVKVFTKAAVQQHRFRGHVGRCSFFDQLVKVIRRTDTA